MHIFYDFLHYHVKNLLNFKGRERPLYYWMYALPVLMIVNIIIAVLVGADHFGNVFSPAFYGYSIFTEQSIITTQEAGWSIVESQTDGTGLSSSYSVFYRWMVVVGTLITGILLVSAATVRRLHDTGRSGKWIFLPLPFLLISIVLMPYMNNSKFILPLHILFFANYFVHLIMFLYLLVVLTASPSIGDNVYGEERTDSLKKMLEKTDQNNG